MLHLHQIEILTIQFIKIPSTALETAPENMWKFSLMVILLVLFNQAALVSLANSPLSLLLPTFSFFFLTLSHH